MAKTKTPPNPTGSQVPQRLTEDEVVRLNQAQADIDDALLVAQDAWLAWATLIRKLGISGCARSMGISTPALVQKIQRIERVTQIVKEHPGERVFE